MSDEWFYGSRSRSQGRENWLWVIVIVFMIMNVGVLSYFTFFRAPGGSGDALNAELDSLRFQISSAQAEIDSLKEEIRIGELPSDTDSMILTQLYNRTRNSVVLIRVQTSSGPATGSGFVYDKEGRIITNNHVVEDAVEGSIEVTFLDGTIVEAEPLGRDPYSDMAVIQVDLPAERLEPVKLGNSSDLLVGETVVAIGNPFGLANTMTNGIVSAVGRQASAPGDYVIVDVIQTDAAINPGNSGGPLLNLRGEVIGINTWILSDTGQFSGIGFAVPSDTIKREIESLIETGTYQHPWIGIMGREMSPDIAEAMDLDRDTRGTLVIDLTEGGPAEFSGLRGSEDQVTIDGTSVKIGGDIIIGADGKTMNSFYDLIFYVSRYKRPGDVLTLKVMCDRDIIDINLTLGVRPSP